MLYLLLAGRSDIASAASSSPMLTALGESFRLMIANDFLRAKMTWARACGVQGSDWFGHLKAVLFCSLCIHPFFRLESTTTMRCDRPGCAPTSVSTHWFSMAHPSLAGNMATQLSTLVLAAQSKSFCNCGSGVRTSQTSLSYVDNMMLCVDIPEIHGKASEILSALTQQIRFPHPKTGTVYDLAGIIFCNGRHFIAWVRFDAGWFSEVPADQDFGAGGESRWYRYDGLKEPTLLRLATKPRPPLNYVPSAALYLRSS